MHFCLLVFSKNICTKEDIRRKIDKFDSEYLFSDECPESEKYPAFSWDWFEIGGRYDSLLKWDFNNHYNNADKPNESMWFTDKKNKRNHRLFESSKLTYLEKHLNKKYNFMESNVEETEWFCLMGARDGYVLVDGCPVNELHESQDKKISYCFYGIDGNSSARSIWDGENFNDISNYEELLMEEWKKASELNAWVTVVDIHD